MLETLFMILVVLVVIGIAIWLFNNYATAIDPKMKSLIVTIAVLVLIIWLVYELIITTHLRFPHG